MAPLAPLATPMIQLDIPDKERLKKGILDRQQLDLKPVDCAVGAWQLVLLLW